MTTRNADSSHGDGGAPLCQPAQPDQMRSRAGNMSLCASGASKNHKIADFQLDGFQEWTTFYIIKRSAHRIFFVRSKFTSRILRFIMYHCCEELTISELAI
ncbi:hypothetical protein CK203_033108 [Vitis vinifera]|uniref:Uncharacterized protein n=1 Tax=Vitis vinifera TaxID=29760 RepID=A0A438G052_VITVI|nr:hypothetical protein CK203_033108 [Vitis vinifera]